MAQTFNDYIVGSSGQAGPYSYSFPVIATTDIVVSVNNVNKTLTSDYTLDTGNNRITFVSGKEPSTGDKVVVYRNTDEDPISSVFESGSTIRSTELNENFKQLLYIAQEADYEKLSRIQPAVMEVDLQMGPDNKIIFEGTTDDAHETTLTVADPTADRTITLPNVTGNVVTTGDTGTVTTQMIEDATIVNADISASAEIAVSKLADGNARQLLQTDSSGSGVEWTSNVDIPGSLDVTSNADIDGDLNVDGSTQLEACGVDGNFDVNTNKFTVNAADGNTTIAGTLTVAGDLDCANLSIDTDELANNAVTAAKLADNSVASSNIINDSIVNADVNASAAIDGTKISPNFGNQNIVTSGSINVGDISGGSVVTTGTSTSDTKVYSAKRSDELYFNLSSGDTIKDGDAFPDNDTTIATTAAINDRIIDLVDDVGGFWPIANETSFPSANPDVNNGPGTIVSIKALNSAITTTSNTTHVITNGAGSGNNVTITNLETNTTYGAGFGLLVETTSTLHTYAFHRLTPKATEVTTVAGIAGNVTTVANNNANVTTVGTNIANVNTVAANNTNVTNVGSNIANVNTCATNLADIENYADTYQVATSAPTTREDSSALQIGDLWFDSSSNKVMMVRDGSSGDGYTAVTPSQSVLADISIVSGNITYSEDLGLITDALSTGSGNSIETCSDNIANIQRLGTADAVADMNVLATADVVADLNTLGTADVVADLNTLGTADCVSDMNTLATSSNVTNMNTLAGIQGNITTVAGISSNVTTVANNNANVTTVAGKATEIGRLGTADAVADMAILGTTDVVADLNTLGTADVVADLNTLGTADVVSDMNTLATSSNVTNMNTLAGISGNITTVAGISSNVTSVAGNTTNINAVAGNATNINAVAADAADIGAVAGKATEIGRLGTADAVADLAILGTTDVVNDMNTLATADVVSDMNTLATADVVADMNTLATADIVSDMNTLATSANVTAMDNCSDDIANINTVSGSIANVNTTATNIANVNTVAGKATEIGRLGTADAVADMAILGTTDVVADMNTLATSDVVADLNTLGTADVVNDMNVLGTSGNVTNMNTLAGISGSISTVAGISSNVTTVAGNNANVTTVANNNANVTTVAGSISNVNTVAGSQSNVNTVAGSIADVNRYANEYKIASSAPGSPSEGDLWYDSTNNVLKYRDDNSWESIAAGIANVDEDTSPTLGGHLDANSKNITNGGTATFSSFVGALTGNASGSSGSCTGNAATATALATARAINGVNFDGSAAITVTAAAGTLTGNTLASGVTASSLTSLGTLSSLTTSGNVTVGGNLTVNGTQTIVNSTTLTVDDKNIELGSVSSPSDSTANGGGMTLKGATDKTFNWVSSNAAWTSSEHLDLASGKVLKIGGTQVLSNSQYTGNAATATILATARTIGGVSFNGSANINLPGVNTAGNQNTSGTAAGLSGSPNITVGTIDGSNLQLDFGTL